MESNCGEIMPELAVRHSAHTLQYRKLAAVRAVHSCHLLGCCEHTAQWTVTHGRRTSHLMLEKVRTSSWLGRQICCSVSPRHFFSHKHTLTKPPAVSITTLYCQRLSALLKGTLAVFLVYWFCSSSGDLNSKFTILPLTTSNYSYIKYVWC